MNFVVKNLISEIERIEAVYLRLFNKYKEEFEVLRDRYIKK
jgi:hypothetical protein